MQKLKSHILSYVLKSYLQAPAVLTTSTFMETAESSHPVPIPLEYRVSINIQQSKSQCSNSSPSLCHWSPARNHTPPRSPCWSTSHKYYNRSSMSPASAGILFIDKKRGGLRPSIDFWRLNQITYLPQNKLDMKEQTSNNIDVSEMRCTFWDLHSEMSPKQTIKDILTSATLLYTETYSRWLTKIIPENTGFCILVGAISRVTELKFCKYTFEAM